MMSDMSQNRFLSLANPISTLVGKEPDQFTRDDLISVIGKKQIEIISFLYPTLNGELKQLRIPITSQYQAEQILTDGERVDGSSLFKGIVDASLSDLYVVPLYKSAFLDPLDKGSLNLLCRYFNSDGELAPFAPDTILHNAYNNFKKTTGYDLYALGELEFYLFYDADSSLYPMPKQSGYHLTSPFLKTGKILDEMSREIARITGAVKYAHSEIGNVRSVRSNLDEIKGKRAEQVEIEFLPTPINDTGDIIALSRWLIHNIAYKHGCIASFAPKVEEGIAGNGLHIHLQLMKNGKNIMQNDKDDLSIPAKKLIGGLCKYADSLTAFGNTVSSAYLRLVPNQEAPTRVCWSYLNRSAMIRVPLGWRKDNKMAISLNPQQKKPFRSSGKRQTVELRSADGSAMIHLLLAGITMATEWGLNNKEAEQVAEKYYVEGNVFQNSSLSKFLPSLPKSCTESSNLLIRKRQLFERESIYPPSIIEFVCKKLKEENDENMNQYLTDLPADDRLLETRKIMHRCLHRY
jgi:glutamine synthetase